MKVYLLSADNEVLNITKRFLQDIQLLGQSDLTKAGESIVHLKGINADCFIASDEAQRKIYDAMGLPYPVVCFKDFENTTYQTVLDGYKNENNYSGVLIGMSHSQCGLNIEDVEDRYIYKMALPSMDMFLHFKYFELLSSRERKAFSDMKDIIIEMPYYIFNYDLSRFGRFTLSKLKYFEYLNDYHNFGVTEEQQNKIDEYRRFVRIFDPLEVQMTSDPQKITIKRMLRRIYNMLKVIENKDKVWVKVYQNTVDENIKYYNELIALIQTRCPKAQIHILVMPFNPLFRWSHRKQINRQKEIFYNAVKNKSIHIIDDFCFFKTGKWFDDHCHLNKNGSIRYSKKFIESLW